ncbi:endoplasmic reticulum junction formation protein lunapark-B-like isoform X2 [Schistocerca piceifrons]|uniref:endoplasmic reticulum junction formation protein lunapark-B-like isoform X2 n=1 Tax=Schistocerca piceifrons TaxID=274613 RepID=UPI001F5E7803|nr:endoplasmic reticulum junction formation protein lunapark-B-like isoform X2 [Schistocerca piceifrons]
MGIVLGRFRKKRTTIEVLEDLDRRIKEMEKRRASTEQTHRVVIGRLVLYSVGTYIIAALVFYFFFFPASLSEQIFYITPLLVFPLIVILLRRGIVWYFKRQITNSETKLAQMEKQKQDILEEVMDKETYKTAKQILERFAPKKELAVVSPLPAKTSASNQKVDNISPSSSAPDLRRRPLGQQQQQQQQQQQPREHFQPPKTSLVPRGRSPTLLQSAPIFPAPMGGRYPGGYTGQSRLAPGPPLPRPIAPRERSVVDRLVDFLIADGPSNRYALICQQCQSHNGLALKEEFEFVAFRCCYCYAMNPARKVRLSPPRIDGIDRPSAAPGTLPSLPPPHTIDSSEGPTDSESERLSRSDSSSEDEEDKKQLSPSSSSTLPVEENVVHGDQHDSGDKEDVKSKLQESDSAPPLPAEDGEKQPPSEEAHKIEELSAAE